MIFWFSVNYFNFVLVIQLELFFSNTKHTKTMGLFSFLKKAGANIFNAKSEEEIRAQKLITLKGVVADLQLPIENLDVDLEEDRVTVYGQVETQSNKEKIVLVLGNVEGVATVDDRISVVAPEPESRFYTVQSGDSLSKISKEMYGDPMKYNSIFEANQPMLKSVDLIYPGQVLRIPNL